MPFAVLILCFTLSGFAALLYETVWARQFAVVFGSGELASASILAAYMGGLALGASLASRWASRIRRPLLVYGVLEAIIGAGALAVPLGLTAVNRAFVTLFGEQPDLGTQVPIASAAFFVVSAFLVLLPCTAAMGATLPLLVRHAVGTDAQIGARTGALYASNTVGAVAGALAAGLWLMPSIGLHGTVRVGIGVNLLVFAIVASVGRSVGAEDAAPDRVGEDRLSRIRPTWIELAMFASGALSFSQELLWTRLLGFVLGGSTAAFATMLAGFLGGIALGSALAARLARTVGAARLGFALSQLGAAVAGRLAFALCAPLVEVTRALETGPNDLFAGALAGAVVLLPLTLCLGMTFPFAVRLLTPDPARASVASARVYGWNTVGAILGSIGTAFVLLPSLGLVGTVVAATTGSALLAVVAAVAGGARRPVLAGVAIALVVAGVALRPAPPWPLLRHSVVAGGEITGDVAYYGVGRSATVLLFDRGPLWLLAANGRPEAGIDRPEMPPAGSSLSRWLAMLPVLLRPDTEHMLVVGLGGGQTVAAVPSTVASVDVIELEAEIVEANRAVAGRAAIDPLADPRVRIHVGDARGLLHLTARRYDAIVSQPSHPWSSGASHLYTREFFALVERRLVEGGVFVQWIGLPFADAEITRTLVATLRDVFAHVELYRPNPGSLLFVASNGELEPGATAARALRVDPARFAAEGIDRVEHFVAARVLVAGEGAAFVGDAPINTDDRNALITRVPRETGLDWFDALLSPFDPLVGSGRDLDAVVPRGSGRDLDAVALTRRLVMLGDRDRARRVAARAARSPAEAHAARGWHALERAAEGEARRAFSAALGVDASLETARVGAAVMGLASQKVEWTERERHLAEASAAARELDWAAVADRDEALGRWQPGETGFLDANRLRIEWRIATDDPDRGREALMQVDAELARRQPAYAYLLRVHAAALAKRPAVARTSLDVLEGLPGAAAARYAEFARRHLEERGPERLAPDP